MEPETADAKAYEAALRESKDRVTIAVLDLCSDLHIRAMLGGGPVLNAHGLIAPGVARNTSLVVDPASIRHLYRALLERGWHDAPMPHGLRLLPSARIRLARDNSISGLILYSVIPGFFADPEETFDLIWERHKEIPLRGSSVRVLGRLTSAILASHDGLDGRRSRQRSNFDYFIRQFKITITDRDRDTAIDLIRQMGGCAEMTNFIEAMGAEPCEFSLPSVAYVRWRLQVTDVSDQLRRALALIELAPHGRQRLYASKSGRPRSIEDIFSSIGTFPRTVMAIFGARRRWNARLSDLRP